MDPKYLVPNIREALAERSLPTVTVWNRLEGRPRTDNFARALKAEVRDALWFVSRQWQMGEFEGDDAGSPIFAKLHMATTRLTKYQADGHPAQFFTGEDALEAQVERRPIAFFQRDQTLALDLRLLMGRHWLKLVSQVGDYVQAFRDKYPISLPDPALKENAYLCAHPEVWQTFAAVAGRHMDGAGLYFYLKADANHHAYDGITVPEADKAAIDARATKFIAWFEQLIDQPPADEDAWVPERLEYQFACSAPLAEGEKVLAAEEYYHGHLDWYNLDVDRRSPGLGEIDGEPPPDPRSTDTQTLIPAPVEFEGMPNTRWWAFEDRKTNFGDVKPDTTDLAKLLLIEFGLVYANDWFLVPYTLPAGTVANVSGMAVTNVFGERFWIEAAGRGGGAEWQRWSLFALSAKGGGPVDTSMVLLPTVPKIQESSPLEEVYFIRDEMANMVWGIEKTIPLATGTGKSGDEAAIETLNFFRQLAPAVVEEERIANEARIQYQIMNSVPENWLPFIPVHVPGDNREIQLQRAAKLRIVPGEPEKPKVEPRTSLLRVGLAQTPAQRYHVHEEEVPRAGIRLTQTYQRTRWHGGRVVVWQGVRKQTGRGEGASGLAFDRIIDIEPPSA